MIAFQHQEFVEALPVLKTIEAHGCEAYFVGGCIRDALLDLPINDIDIATSAYPAEVQAMFPKHFDVGLEHGTVMVWQDGLTFEVTTFRTESTYQDYRRPDKVEFIQSLEEDLKRRDFTMNALAMTSSGDIIDYFGGKKDIASRCIRAVGNPNQRFGEDALRMMRAVRFASQLNFELETKTKQALANLAPLLEKIAIERILVEMNKLWTGKNWHKGLQLLISSELYSYCPCLSTTKAILQQLGHDLSTSNHITEPNFAWALLLNYAKQSSAVENELKNTSAAQFARAWKMSNADGKKIGQLVAGLEYRENHADWSNWQLYELGSDICLYIEAIIAEEQEVDSLFGRRFSQAKLNQTQTTWRNLAIYSLKDLAVNGQVIINQFNPKEKKIIGQALKLCEEQVVLNKVENTKSALLALIKAQFNL